MRRSSRRLRVQGSRVKCYRTFAMATFTQPAPCNAHQLGGPASVVETACPLDCPDACSARTSPCSTARSSRSTARTRTRSPTATSARRCGSSASASTVPIGCSIPPSARAAKGEGQFKRVTWDEALELVADRFTTRQGRARAATSILPYSYGGSNGLLTQDNLDATAVAPLRHVAAGAHGVRRADRRGQHGALRQDAVGHLPGLSRREADRAVGRQPVGLGHPSRAVRARGPEARREAGRRSIRGRTPLARDRRPASGGQAGHRRRASRSRSIGICSTNGHADEAFLREHTRGCETAARTRGAVDDRARRRGRRHRRAALADASRICTPRARRRSIRCGWGLERNRNGGNAAMAVLALPAVGGKFGVRGGGYSMSNSASWGIERPWIDAPRAGDAPRQHEPSGPRADRVRRSAGRRAVRLQLQSRGDRARSAARAARPRTRRICSPSSSSR